MFGRKRRWPDFEGLFVQATDVPGWSRVQPMVTRHEAEPGDEAWDAYQGIESGFNVWESRPGDGLSGRLIDIRWLFGSEQSATQYHDARAEIASEGMHPIGPCRFGAHGLLFTGLIESTADIPYQLYNQLFVIGPVVAKVYVAGVRVDEADEFARLAESRIADWLLPSARRV